MNSEAQSRNRDKKRTLTPKLRFPEFRDAGEWHTEPLRELATIIDERVGDRTYTPLSVTSGVGLVTQEEKFGRIIAGKQYRNYIVLQHEDFAYNKSATKEYPQGFIAIYLGNEPASVPNSIFTCFRVKKEKLDPAYLNYLFINNLHGRWISTYVTTGARAHGSLNINDEDLLSLPIPKPNGHLSKVEQQKIANCLSSVDELIGAEAGKLGALKTHKEGLMQQLFPAEGETTPSLRFPEFRGGAKWEEKSFSEFIAEMESGVSVNSYDSPVTDGSTPGILKTSCVTAGVFLSHENKKIVESEATLARTIPKENTILVSRMNTPGLVGESGYVDADYPNLFLPDRLWRLSCDESIVHTIFFSKYLASDKMRASLGFAATGTSASMKNISKPTFLNFKLRIPSTIEQKKIADFLSAIDNRITIQTQKLKALKNHKKSLMQQIFPAQDESL